MSYRKIQGALDTHLQALSSDDVVFPSHPFAPKTGQEFVVAQLIPGRANTVLLGPDMPAEYRGLYQIDIRGLDVVAALDQVDQLRNHFAKGQILTFEGMDIILEQSEAGPNRGNLKHTNIPLTIHWRSYF